VTEKWLRWGELSASQTAHRLAEPPWHYIPHWPWLRWEWTVGGFNRTKPQSFTFKCCRSVCVWVRGQKHLMLSNETLHTRQTKALNRQTERNPREQKTCYQLICWARLSVCSTVTHLAELSLYGLFYDDISTVPRGPPDIPHPELSAQTDTHHQHHLHQTLCPLT